MNIKMVKKMLIVLIIVALSGVFFRSVIISQNWYTTKDIFALNLMFFQGDSNKELPYIVPEMQKNVIYDLPRVAYHIDNKEGVKVYNTFLVEGLKPVTEYQFEIDYNATLYNDYLESFEVGAINYEPDDLYDAQKKAYVANISTNVSGDYAFNKLFAIKGFNRYKTTVKVVTNEYGSAWIVIGVIPTIGNEIDFNLGQLKIKTTEINDVNQFEE